MMSHKTPLMAPMHPPPSQSATPDDSAAPQSGVEPRELTLPDARYFARVARRQAPFVGALLALYVPVVGLATLLTKPVYEARIAALYDERDRLLVERGYGVYPRFQQVAESFRSKLGDDEFLYKVALTLGASAPKGKEGSWLAPIVQRVRTLLGKGAPDERQQRQALARELLPRLVASADDKNQMLFLTARGATPDAAQRLADQAMESFLAAELTFEAEAAQSQFEILRSFFETESTQARNTKAAASSAAGENTASLATLRELEERLRREDEELESRVQRLRASLAAEVSTFGARRAALDAELARLSAQLTPSHPDYIAKQEELRRLPRAPDTRALNAELASLVKQQARVRAEMRKHGVRALPLEDRVRPSNFLPELEEQLHTAELESAKLREQIANPQARTRMRALGAATLDVESGKNQRQTAMLLVALGVVSALGFGALREVRNPRAADGWRVRNRAGVAVLCELERRLGGRYGSLSRLAVQDLRRAAAKNESARGARERRDAAALLAFRHAACLLGNGFDATGRPTLLLPAGSEDRTADCFGSLLNVYADERAGKSLVIDLAHRDPLATSSDAPLVTADLACFLAGRAAWKDVRLEANEARAFALVPAPDEQAIAEGATRNIRAETLRQLFGSLAKTYQHVFVRGFPADQPAANRELVAAAGAVFVVCDARRSTHADVARALASVPRAKLRGLILTST